MSKIKENLNKIQQDIKEVLEGTNRNIEDITIIGVTKTVDVERIQELVDLGVKNLGENRVQELLDKYDKISGDVNWHLIGHLQTNKVKYIIDKVTMIHSVDNIKLVKEIDKRAKQHNLVMDILIQVNIGEEESKFGVKLNQAEDFIKEVKKYQNVSVKGLMCIAPLTDDVALLESLFINLYKIYVDNINKNIDNDSNHLSMGMSNDYKLAIKCGSNMVRIGTSLFGDR